MTGHAFDASILREYDVRGVVGETLSPADAVALGKTFGTRVRRLGGSTVAVGYDGRLSSPDMEAALVEGLISTGVDVLRIGLGPTPMLYYATKALNTDGGIMITGSHNPPDFNGFKMMLQGKSFFGDDIRALGPQAAAGDWETGQGAASVHPLADAYVERLLQDYDAAKPLRVVWDAGNGAAGQVLRDLVARLPGEHIVLFGDVDGTFPNHHPDPTVPANLTDLMAAVASHGADLGIAFDGDGDRIGVVDNRGGILWGDQLLLLMAEDLLKALPGATVIADVKASQVLYDGVAALGGQPLMYKTGHSLIKTKMAETGAPLAGEMSGHIFYADKYYGFDDALYAAVRFLGIVSRLQGETLADRMARMPSMVNTPEIRIDCSEDRKFAVIDEVKARLSGSGAEVNAIDGVRVSTADGWWLLRASNTQPVLVARCEAKDDGGLERLKALLMAQLDQSGVAFVEAGH